MTKHELLKSIIEMPSKKQLDKVVKQPYEEIEVSPELEDKINKLMQFFDHHGIDYSKFDPESIPKLILDKKRAYPNNDSYMYIPGQHNTQKWLEAVREVFFKEKSDGRVK